eukprot:997287_1
MAVDNSSKAAPISNPDPAFNFGEECPGPAPEDEDVKLVLTRADLSNLLCSINTKWKHRLQALDEVVRLTTGDSLSINERSAIFKEFTPFLALQIMDLRSAVVRATCGAIESVVRVRSAEICPFAPVLLEALLNVQKITIKVISASAAKCAEFMVKTIQDDIECKLLSTVADGAKHTNARVRTQSITAARFQLESKRTGAEISPERSTSSRNRIMSDIISRGVIDAKVEVRIAALWCLYEFSKVAEEESNRIISTLNRATRCHFDEEISSKTPFREEKSKKRKRKRPRKKAAHSLAIRAVISRLAEERRRTGSFSPNDPRSPVEIHVSPKPKGAEGRTTGEEGARETAVGDAEAGAVQPIQLDGSLVRLDFGSPKRSAAAGQDGSVGAPVSTGEICCKMDLSNDDSDDSIPKSPPRKQRKPSPPMGDEGPGTEKRCVSEELLAEQVEQLLKSDSIEDQKSDSMNNFSLQSFLGLEAPTITERMTKYLAQNDICDLLMRFLSRLPDGVSPWKSSVHNADDPFHFCKFDRENETELNNNKMSYRLMKLINPETGMSDPPADFLEKKGHLILLHALACWSPESSGNCFHACGVLQKFAENFPKIILKAITTKPGDRLFHNFLFSGLHSANSADTAVEIFSVSERGDDTKELRSKLFAQIEELDFINRVMEITTSPSTPERVSSAYANFLAKLLDEMSRIEGGDTFFAGRIRRMTTELITAICNSDGAHPTWQRIQCIKLVNQFYTNLSQKGFPVDVNPLMALLGMPNPDPIMNHCIDEFPHFADAICVHLPELCAALENEGIHTFALPAGSTTSTQFSVFKASLLQLFCALSVHSDTAELVAAPALSRAFPSQLPRALWETLSRWLFELRSNNIFQCYFKKLFVATVKLKDPETLRLLLQEMDLLSKLLDFYSSEASRTVLHSFILDLSTTLMRRIDPKWKIPRKSAIPAPQAQSDQGVPASLRPVRVGWGSLKDAMMDLSDDAENQESGPSQLQENPESGPSQSQENPESDISQSQQILECDSNKSPENPECHNSESELKMQLENPESAMIDLADVSTSEAVSSSGNIPSTLQPISNLTTPVGDTAAQRIIAALYENSEDIENQNPESDSPTENPESVSPNPESVLTDRESDYQPITDEDMAALDQSFASVIAGQVGNTQRVTMVMSHAHSDTEDDEISAPDATQLWLKEFLESHEKWQAFIPVLTSEIDRQSKSDCKVPAHSDMDVLENVMFQEIQSRLNSVSESENKDNSTESNDTNMNEGGANGPGANGPGAAEPGANGSGANGPGASEPGANGSGSDEPGATEPGANGSGSDEPGATEPGANGSGTDEPGANESGATEASMGEPSAVEQSVAEIRSVEPNIGEGSANVLCASSDDIRIESNSSNVVSSNELSAIEPGANESGVNESGVNEPGANEPGANESGVNEPGANDHSANEPSANESGANESTVMESTVIEPGANESGANGHSMNEPGVNEPGVNESDANEHSPKEPGANESGANEHSLKEHGATQSDCSDGNTGIAMVEDVEMEIADAVY